MRCVVGGDERSRSAGPAEHPPLGQGHLLRGLELGQTIQQSAQFIIATHSPIVAAFPGALIFSFDSVPVAEVAYQDLEHVNLTRSFLDNPEQFLRHLF